MRPTPRAKELELRQKEKEKRTVVVDIFAVSSGNRALENAIWREGETGIPSLCRKVALNDVRSCIIRSLARLISLSLSLILSYRTCGNYRVEVAFITRKFS